MESFEKMWGTLRNRKFNKVGRTILTTILCGFFIIFTIGCSSESKKSVNQVNDKKLTNEVLNTNVSVNGELKVHFIDVGQADSILIQQGNSSMLIDAGNNEDSETVKNYIVSQGIKKLDYVIGTHPHEDHIGGLDYVINSFEIGNIYMPKATSTTKTFKAVINSIQTKKMQITTPQPGDSFKLGQADCKILAPNSASDEFLKKVSPKYAVISVGKDNDYGHPHKETMAKLKNSGISVYRTDECGTIVCTSDGNNINFSSKSGSYDIPKVTSNNNSSTSSSKETTTTKDSNSGSNKYIDSNGNGLIKGSQSKIYHVPGSKYYDTTKNVVQWFKSVEEAEAAGYRAPKN